MAKTLKSFTFARNTKYPWDKWADGRIWQATCTDFGCAPKIFVAQLHHRATLEEKHVRTFRDGDTVTFQFYGSVPNGKPAKRKRKTT